MCCFTRFKPSETAPKLCVWRRVLYLLVNKSHATRRRTEKGEEGMIFLTFQLLETKYNIQQKLDRKESSNKGCKISFWGLIGLV